MGYGSPSYVVEQNGNVIKYTLDRTDFDRRERKTFCLIIEWLNDFIKCRLFSDNDIRIINIINEDIVNIEKLIKENNFFELKNKDIEENDRCSGHWHEKHSLEIKIGDKYNHVSTHPIKMSSNKYFNSIIWYLSKLIE